MQIVRYNPLTELQKMQSDLDKILDNSLGIFASTTDTAPLDMYQEAGKMIAEVNLPNFNKDEIKVTANAGVLEISAEHKEEKEVNDKRHYYMRESSNQYYRRVGLPEGVDTDKTEAEFKDGKLKIIMPIETNQETRSISIK